MVSLKNKKYWYPLSIGTYDIEEISSALESLINFRTSMSLKTKKFSTIHFILQILKKHSKINLHFG